LGILEKNVFGRRRQFFWTGGSPPQTEIDRRAAADTVTSAHGSISDTVSMWTCIPETTVSFYH